MKTIKFIYELIKKHYWLFTINLLLIISSSLVMMMTAISIAPLLAVFIGGTQFGSDVVTNKLISSMNIFCLPFNIYTVGILFVLLKILSALCQIAVQRCILVTKYSVVRDILLGTYNSFFNAKWSFFSNTNHGVLLNTFLGEAGKIGDAFGAIARLFATVAQICIVMLLPFYLSWELTLLCCILGFFLYLPLLFSGRIAVNLGRRNTKTANHFSSMIQESLVSAKIVLGFGNQHKNKNDINEAYNEHRKATLKSQTFAAFISQISAPISVIIIIIIIFTVKAYGIPLTKMAIVIYSLHSIVPMYGQLVSGKFNIDNFFPSYEQIMSLKKKADILKQVTGDIIFKNLNIGIQIKNLTFGYNENQPVLKDININIPQGKMIAIVGESGSGKSTLVDVIIGFNTPNTGNIQLDNYSIAEYDICSFRKKIGYVPQDNILFDMSIKDNLLWANPEATFQEIVSACSSANADEFINEFTKKYDTMVGNRGVRLSGGQAQRIALARAIIRKPELLILDEATSSLDSNSEKLIQKSIDNIAKTTTTIVIAHRLSTIKNSDYIYVLNKGSIAEEGDYTSLMRKNGLFEKMVQTQNFNE